MTKNYKISQGPMKFVVGPQNLMHEKRFSDVWEEVCCYGMCAQIFHKRKVMQELKALNSLKKLNGSNGGFPTPWNSYSHENDLAFQSMTMIPNP